MTCTFNGKLFRFIMLAEMKHFPPHHGLMLHVAVLSKVILPYRTIYYTALTKMAVKSLDLSLSFNNFRYVVAFIYSRKSGPTGLNPRL